MQPSLQKESTTEPDSPAQQTAERPAVLAAKGPVSALLSLADHTPVGLQKDWSLTASLLYVQCAIRNHFILLQRNDGYSKALGSLLLLDGTEIIYYPTQNVNCFFTIKN